MNAELHSIKAEIAGAANALRQIADELARLNAREEQKFYVPPREDNANPTIEWVHRIFDVLGAPRNVSTLKHPLTIAERISWLQARNG